MNIWITYNNIYFQSYKRRKLFCNRKRVGWSRHIFGRKLKFRHCDLVWKGYCSVVQEMGPTLASHSAWPVCTGVQDIPVSGS